MKKERFIIFNYLICHFAVVVKRNFDLLMKMNEKHQAGREELEEGNNGEAKEGQRKECQVGKHQQIFEILKLQQNRC